jgi:hypothetical protein
MAFAYFYFDFSDAKKQLVGSFIRSLVTQFSRKCPSFPDGLAALYSNCLDGAHQPTTKSVMKVLREVIVLFRHAYIVLDALDECGDREKLLLFIEEIVGWDLTNLHILATSRPEQMIHDYLSNVSDTIDLPSALVDADIRIHIRERLQNDFRLRRWPLVVKEEIESSLMAGANGM